MTSYIGVPPFSQTVRTTTSLTASNNQTTFYPTGGYIVGYLDVSINGVKLIEGSDYSAGDGVSVVLTTGTSNNDVIDFTAYGAISFADSVKRSGDTITGTILVQDLIPTSNNTYSLGNTTNRFANIYLSGNTIVLGDATISTNTTHVSFAMANGDPMPLAANLNASLPDTGVVANTYGNSTSIPIITVDSQGRVTNASTSSVSGVTGLTYTSANNTLTVSTSISNYDASIQVGLDEAYANAVAHANTISDTAYANAVAHANTISDTAYANAVSAANTLASNFAANAYANAVSAANTLASDFAANAYANVFNGGTFTGDTTFTANITGNNVTLNGNLQIDGDLTISGNTTTVSAASLVVTDNMIYMNQGISATITNIVGDGANVVFTANNNYANGWDVSVTGVDPASYNGNYANILEANATHFVVANTNTDSYVSGGTARGKTDANPDIGFAAGYNDGTYHHAGLFRDATDARWKFFHEYLPEPDESVFIDTANASFTFANVQANYFIGTLSGDASSVGGNTASTLLGAADTAYSNATSYAATIAGTAYSNAVSVASSTYLPLAGGTVSGNLSLTGKFTVGTFPNSTTNSGEAWIGRAADRSAGTLTVQLGSGAGRKFEVVDSGWTTVEFSADDSGIATAAGSFRAPIFYDNNNTGYYIDPNSTTSLRTVGSWRADSSSWDGDYSGKIQYHSNSWYLQAAGNFLFRNSGGTNIFDVNQSGTAIAVGDMRAPIFYDYNDTGYYTNPASTSNLNALALNTLFLDRNEAAGRGISWYSSSYTSWANYMSPAGATGSGPTANITAPSGTLVTSWALRSFIEGIAGYGWTFEQGSSSGQPSVVAEIRSSDGAAQFNGSVRSPIFYDSNDTGYYTDPNSTSNLYNLSLSGAKNTYLTINPGNNYEAMVRYIGGSGSGWYVGKRTASALVGTESFHFYSEAAAATVSGIDTGGNVFASGSHRAPIFYDYNNTGYYADPASTSYFNVIYSISYFYHSDRNKKTNIIPLSEGLGKILKLNSVTFDWKESKEHDTGLIAQEVAEVIPEAVKDNSIRASTLISYLIKAVQELDAKYQNKINTLETEILQLKGLS